MDVAGLKNKERKTQFALRSYSSQIFPGFPGYPISLFPHKFNLLWVVRNKGFWVQSGKLNISNLSQFSFEGFGSFTHSRSLAQEASLKKRALPSFK